MKRNAQWIITALAVCAVLLPIKSSYADNSPVYTPPETGAPTRRLGAGTRSSGRLSFFVVAPESTGHVMNAQPMLYWFTNQPIRQARFRLQQISPMTSKPVLEVKVRAKKGGVQAINLAAHKVQLKYDVIYEWSIVLPASPGKRKALTSATLKRVPPTPKLKQSLAKAKKGSALYAVYARSGFWYDAISNISALIDARPEDTMLLTHRVVLMEQVALPKIARAY